MKRFPVWIIPEIEKKREEQHEVQIPCYLPLFEEELPYEPETEHKETEYVIQF